MAELEEVLEENRADVIQQHLEKEQLLQDKWKERKRVTTLTRIEKDYNVLDDQNKAYDEERKEIKQRLARVLKFTKALHNTYKP